MSKIISSIGQCFQNSQQQRWWWCTKCLHPGMIMLHHISCTTESNFPIESRLLIPLHNMFSLTKKTSLSGPAKLGLLDFAKIMFCSYTIPLLMYLLPLTMRIKSMALWTLFLLSWMNQVFSVENLNCPSVLFFGSSSLPDLLVYSTPPSTLGWVKEAEGIKGIYNRRDSLISAL